MPRRSDLIEERNLRIYTEFKRMTEEEGRRYGWALEYLEGKFFISRATISNIVQEHSRRESK